MVNGIYTNGYTYSVNSYGSSGTRTNEPTDAQIRAMKRSGSMRCETCASRSYVDGSDEMDVSFKSPGHISPQASAGTVMAHERQHVSNAYESASKKDGRVVQASVTLDYARCPECGRSYVAGGETVTAIKYTESNPYGANAKAYDAANGAIGSNINIGL
ncbi:MAG: hypothetical protein ACI4EN_06175 [Butyrivibrio sp.]